MYESNEKERRHEETEKRYEERVKRENELSARVEQAQRDATPEGKRWEVRYDRDPASGKYVGRRAVISSNDNLCKLSVQLRMNGNQLTGLECPGFEISAWRDIEVKFDNVATSATMDLEGYSDGSGVYIPSSQSPSYSAHLDYEKFLARLQGGTAVAVKVPVLDGIWVTFSLNGSSEAIGKLGMSFDEIER